MRPTKFEIKGSIAGANGTLSLVGELDMRTLGQLTDRLTEQLDAGARDVRIDLRELAFMDPSGLRLRIELHDRSRQDGWQLQLVCPEQEGAALVLRATGADQRLPFVRATDP